MTEKCLSYNNLMNNRVNISKIENSLYLDNNDPILVAYIQNNNINFNTNNNIMSIKLKVPHVLNSLIKLFFLHYLNLRLKY